MSVADSLSPAKTNAVPKPTRDFKQGLKNIAGFGLTIVPGVLGGDVLKRAREALYRAAESDRARGREQKFGLDYATDDSNQRVWNVLSRDPVFEDMAFHETAVAYVKGVLGWPALLGNISANITGPGGGEMVLHADQIFVPEPWPAEPQGLNVAWCLDDFTDANGATLTLPVNSAGNFASVTPLAFPVKAEVHANGKVRAMATPQASGDCNSCHTQAGANMAPGRIALP